MTMHAPFPYAGGKTRWADTIWQHLGHPDVYCEPFAGSLAVLLAKPGLPARREVACDLGGGVCNFWRALKHDAALVAYWADCPSYHRELLARKRWYFRWLEREAPRLEHDMDYWDAKAAGIWCWGHAVSIRSKFDKESDLSIPVASSKVGGQGVSRQRLDRPKDLTPWLFSISDRLAKVLILNRNWTSGVTPSVMAYNTPGVKAVLLDPPYLLEAGVAPAYGHSEPSVARDAYEWALEHGDEYRIAYCCHDGDFPVPDGWTAEVRGLRGVVNRRERNDMVMFSPACVRDPGLFD